VDRGKGYAITKACLPETSTDAETMGSPKRVALNAPASVRDNLDLDSDMTEGSDVHLKAQVK
jgi:hypothetical protein